MVGALTWAPHAFHQAEEHRSMDAFTHELFEHAYPVCRARSHGRQVALQDLVLQVEWK
jgi:hypothetical protein